MFGLAASEAMGRDLHSVIAPTERRAQAHDGLRQFATDGQGKVLGNLQEMMAMRHDGSVFPAEVGVASFQMADGWHAVGTIRDITQRLEAQRERDEALELINGSINYATRIQHSILPLADCLSSVTRDHFVLWEPRDRVGGDMYWCKPWGLGKLIALGDCTGHGVPGAFVTLIANGALEMALLETRPGDAGALLQRVHNLIQDILKQNGDTGESDDGLEMGVCFIHPKKKPTLIFAGARFSLFHVDDGMVNEIKGDKRGIGYRGLPRQGGLTNHAVDILARRAFYMTSDGLIDQVGGAKRRGFGKRRFMEVLRAIQPLPMAEQQQRIQQTLAMYQGDEKRRDDVSVVGFRLDGTS